MKVLEGLNYMQLVSIEDNNTARLIAEEVVAMCPENPWGYISWVGSTGWI